MINFDSEATEVAWIIQYLRTKEVNNGNLLLLFLEYDEISNELSCLDVK